MGALPHISLLPSKHPSTTGWCSLLGSCFSKKGHSHLQWQHSHHQAELGGAGLVLTPMGRGATQPGSGTEGHVLLREAFPAVVPTSLLCHSSTQGSLPELWACVPGGAGPLLTHQPRQPRLARVVEQEAHLENVAQAQAQRESGVSPQHTILAHLRKILPAAPWRAEKNSLFVYADPERISLKPLLTCSGGFSVGTCGFNRIKAQL